MSSGCEACFSLDECTLIGREEDDIYEIHVTVANGDVEKFKRDCESIGVKPLLLDLHNKRGGTFPDLMTSSPFRGSFDDAVTRIIEIVASLHVKGYEVVRYKLETTPFNPKTPSVANGILSVPKGTYFEAHLPVVISGDHETSVVQWLATFNNLHLSRNVFKMGKNGYKTMMLTKRSYTDLYEEFKADVDAVASDIRFSGITLKDKIVVEYAILDSKIDHDSAWTGDEV